MTSLQESILSVLFLVMGIGISILVLIFVSTLGGGVYTNTQSNIDVISADTLNETTGNLSFASLPSIYNTSGNIYPGTEILKIWNTTAEYGTLELTTNYTVLSYSSGQFTITDISGYNDSYIYLNVSYTTGNPVIEGNLTSAIKSSFVGIGTIGGYMPIIVLAIIIIIVLGLVMTLNPSYGRTEYGNMAL